MAIPYESGEALTCQQIRELDILAIEHVGIPGMVLMENAARAVAEVVYASLLNATGSNILFMCGPGNNGGDGFAAARQLRNAGVQVCAALCAPAGRLRGDAGGNLAIYQRMGGDLLSVVGPDDLDSFHRRARSADVIVDALLGTGTSGPPRGVLAEVIRIANSVERARRVAIDIPTGLDADAGVVSDPCFQADATVTFVAEKVGFGSAAARAVLGRVVTADIGIPGDLIPGRNVRRRA
jgi:hydroxyethylthiazole kinase-like uncharacterized protein yjeF